MSKNVFISLVFLGILLGSLYSIFFHFKNYPAKEIPALKSVSKIVNTTTLNTTNFVPTTPSLNQIFSDNHNWTATLSSQKTIKILATGDVIPARSVNTQTLKAKDFTWAWKYVAKTLKNADLTIINLETPIIDNCPPTDKGMIFCGNSKHIEGLIFAGVDIATLANNHIANFGKEGIEETKNLLNQNGIATAGINNQAQIPLNNKKITILAYNEIEATNPYVNKIDKDKIRKDIVSAKKNSDIIIVSYHWGAEYQSQPEKYRINLAHQTIDWGADLIIGNHPHWIQPIEIYKDKIITYAHGNFIFDQEWSRETKNGVVGIYTFYNNKIIDIEFLPVLIENYGQVKFLDGSDKQKVLDDMYYQSQILIKSIND